MEHDTECRECAVFQQIEEVLAGDPSRSELRSGQDVYSESPLAGPLPVIGFEFRRLSNEGQRPVAIRLGKLIDGSLGAIFLPIKTAAIARGCCLRLGASCLSFRCVIAPLCCTLLIPDESTRDRRSPIEGKVERYGKMTHTVHTVHTVHEEGKVEFHITFYAS